MAQGAPCHSEGAGVIEREQLLDELARCFARAAVDALLAELDREQEAAAEEEQKERAA